MLVAGFDCETTGLDTDKDYITELGAVLWDTERGVPLKILSTLTWPHDTEIKLDHKIVELTGITEEDLAKHAVPFEEGEFQLANLVANADLILAHNGNLFDRPMLNSNSARFGTKFDYNKFLWADSTCDIDFPPTIQTRKLSHLAAEHGFLNPFAHRAVFDVLTMLKIAQRYDWKQITEFAKSPTISIEAQTTFEQRELAKKAGYRWNADKKKWVKSIKQFKLKEEQDAAKALGFQIRVK